MNAPKPAPLADVIEFPRQGRASAGQRRQAARRIIAVGGGKGGIGKTMVSANLAIALAQRGRSVVLMDADLGGANTHTCLGIDPPTRTLSDFISRRSPRLVDVVTPTGIEGLGLIAGAQGLLDAANPKHAQKVKLLRHIQALDVDYVLLDLGAGTTLNVLDFFLIANHGVVVLLPEPTSIENAYRFIKAALFRKLQLVAAEYGIEEEIQQVSGGQATGLRTPAEIVERLRQRDSVRADLLSQEIQCFNARLVVNQTRSAADVDVGLAVVSAWKKFFGLKMDYLGAIGYDDEAWKAVRRRRPVLLEQPGSLVSQGLTQVTDNLLALDGRDGPPVTP